MACFSCSDDITLTDNSLADISKTLECDYDVNPTGLYQAMEQKEWDAAYEFLVTGIWDDGGIFSSSRVDPLTPARQAKTWVTRYEEAGGSIRWSQLPLHAAIIFKAPAPIITKLIELYPQGVRCTDDQHMLPLHLAIKCGSDDKILAKLVEDFPEAMTTKDVKGRLPLQVDGPRKEFKKVIEAFVCEAEQKCQKELAINIGNVDEFKQSIALKDKLLNSMESHNHELEEAYAQVEQENEKLRREMKTMRKMITRAEKAMAAAASGELREGVVYERNTSRGIPKATHSSKTRSDQLFEYSPETLDARYSSKTSPSRSAKSTRLPRRGFFKGFGAKE